MLFSGVGGGCNKSQKQKMYPMTNARRSDQYVMTSPRQVCDNDLRVGETKPHSIIVFYFVPMYRKSLSKP